MTGLVLRLQLFLLSYVPLFAIFAVRSIPDTDYTVAKLWPSVVWLSIAMIGVIGGLWINAQAYPITSVSIKIDAVDDQGPNAAAYLATYLFPFILVGQSSWQTWAAYAIYAAVLLVVTTRSTLILVNPTLYLFGRRVVMIDHQRVSGSQTSNTVRSILICRRAPRPGDTVSATVIADGYIET